MTATDSIAIIAVDIQFVDLQQILFLRCEERAFEFFG